MGNTGVDRNDQVQARNEGGGLGKIGELGSVIDDLGSGEEERLIVRSWILLQTQKSATDIQNGGQHAQRHGSIVIISMLWISGPYKANPQPVASSKPCFPGRQAFCARRQVWSSGWNCVESRSKGERQTR